MGRTRRSTAVFAAAYIVLVIGLFLALGGAAYAANPPSSATDQYGTKVAGVKVSATAETETAAAQAESLPNTGLSLVGVVVVGGALVAGGIVLRRRERGKNST